MRSFIAFDVGGVLDNRGGDFGSAEEGIREDAKDLDIA